MADQGDRTVTDHAPGEWPAPAAAYLDLNDLGGFDWDLEQGRAHFEPPGLRVLGLEPGEYDGDPRGLLSRLAPAEADRLRREVAEALDGGRASGDVQFRLTRHDGTLGWIHARGRVIRDATGLPCRVIGIVRDATDELDQAAARLHDDEERPRPSHLVIEVTASLAEAVTVRDVTAALTDSRRMSRLGIASLFLGLVEAGRVHVVAEGRSDSYVPDLRYTRIDDNFPMSEVVRTQEPRFITSKEEFADRYPKIWPYLEPLDVSAAAYLPLIAQGRPIGALGLLYHHKQSFAAQERDLLIALSGSIAQSLKRAMLFDYEHDIAQGLQTAMLPRGIPDVPGTRTAVRYRSARLARDVGGDWYDVVALPGGRVAVVIGDVQGHDTHAAAVMGQLRIALRAYAAEGHPPATVMARASAFLTELDTDRFATCLYAQIDPASGATAIVRAGHISPLLRRADGTCSQLDVAGGLPLGLAGGFEDLGFPVTTTEIEPGETLLMFSDGLVERPGADLDDGLKLLADAFRAGPDDVQHLADQLCEAMGDQGSDDDMALLLLRRDTDGLSGPARRLRHHVGPGDPESLAAARTIISRTLNTWELPERADDAVLVAHELITNALVHTDGGAVLNLRHLPGTAPRLRVEVQDLGGDWPSRRVAGDSEVSGRGLVLVSRLADAWGVEPQGGGKIVWCEFRTPQPRP